MSIITSLTGQVTPTFMLNPPQEHLLEKYFHPDHMSSAEKMKLELKRVRDEFKMSESDWVQQEFKWHNSQPKLSTCLLCCIKRINTLERGSKRWFRKERNFSNIYERQIGILIALCCPGLV